MIFPSKIDKRSIIRAWCRDREDLADHDVVVTPVIDPYRPALHGGECVHEEYGPGLLAPGEREAGKLPFQRPASGSEPIRRLDRILAEHGHRPASALQYCLVKPRDLLDTDKDQERVNGYRGEGIGRHRVIHTVRRPGGHDGDPGDKAA